MFVWIYRTYHFLQRHVLWFAFKNLLSTLHFSKLWNTFLLCIFMAVHMVMGLYHTLFYLFPIVKYLVGFHFYHDKQCRSEQFYSKLFTRNLVYFCIYSIHLFHFSVKLQNSHRTWTVLTVQLNELLIVLQVLFRTFQDFPDEAC